MLHQDALKRTVISRTPYTAPSTAKAENVFLLSLAHMHNNNTFQAANILYHSSFPVNTQCNVSVSTQPGIHYEQTCRRCQPPLLRVRIYVFEKEKESGREREHCHTSLVRDKENINMLIVLSQTLQIIRCTVFLKRGVLSAFCGPVTEWSACFDHSHRSKWNLSLWLTVLREGLMISADGGRLSSALCGLWWSLGEKGTWEETRCSLE